MSRWTVHSTRPAYQSEWVDVWLDDVELPDGERFEHHVVKFPRRSVGAVVVDRDQTLMIWRHRHITEAWGWEIPAGWADHGEDLARAAAREVEEETGYRAASLSPLVEYNNLSGISTMRYHVFLATDVAQVGRPDEAEASRVQWTPVADLPQLVADGQVVDGPSLTALLYYLAVRVPGHS
jgi:8-oxo-dGTP pyrophosphatase MutT (NUDIX family)